MVLKWCKLYNLKVSKVNCPQCSFEQILDIPWRGGRWVGLQAKEHGCGPRYQACVGKPSCQKHRQQLSDALGFLTKKLR